MTAPAGPGSPTTSEDNTIPFFDELFTALRAGQVLLSIHGREPRRFAEALKPRAEAAGYVIDELRLMDPDDDRNREAFHEWLDSFARSPQPTISLVHDALPWLALPGTRRRALEVAHALSGKRRHILFLSQFSSDQGADAARALEDLSGLVRRMRFPLPDEAARRSLVGALLAEADAPEGFGLAPKALIDRLAALLAGLSRDEIGLALREAMLACDGSEAVLVERVRDRKVHLIRSSRALELRYPQEGIQDLGGLDLLKDWLTRRKRAFLPEARRFGLPQPRGLMLFGVQGCGKSLSAAVLSRVFELPLLRLDFASLFGGHDAEAGFNEALASVEAMAPVVLWIDEIDKLFPDSALHAAGGSPALLRVFAAFLTWMQERETPVFVVATANDVERLPPELMRRGRFDELFFLDLPGVQEREEIFAIQLARRGRRAPALGIDLRALARQAVNFSGAEIEQVVISALYSAFEARRELAQADLEEACRVTVPLYVTHEGKVKALRDFARSRARLATSDTDVLDLFQRS